MDQTHSSITAALRYIEPSDVKPVYTASKGGENAQLDINVDYDDKQVAVHDARLLAEPASIDREGFTLVAHHTKVADFYALAQYQSHYEAELRDLILPITGGQDMLVFDHTLRSDSASIRSHRGTREATSLIHNDYTTWSARKRVRDLLGEQEAERRLQRRFTIVNVWRSIRGTVYRSPLACCDAQTISESDIIGAERRTADRIGELELVTFNPAHRWYYYSAMQPDEVLLIKTFDSQAEGRVKRAIHSAFSNPLAPAGAPPRESMETRMLVFF